MSVFQLGELTQQLKNKTIKFFIFTQSGQHRYRNIFELSKQNNAIYFGGAIYMQNCTNDFKIIKSMIMENNAYQGGGIFFNGSNQLNAINFENSLVQQNNALLFANNLVEDPHHLSLLINGKEMGSVQNKLDNITSNILKIKSYKIVEQGQQQSTNILILPSNQIISNYKIFNPQNLNYIKFIYELQLNYKNTLNEKLLNFSDSFCTLDLTNQSLNNSLSNAQTIFYNQQIDGFDLGAQSISFDPYINNSQVFKLKINCCSKFYQKNLQYIITGKTFKCQLGEFYYNEGCSLCEPSQGFYSVTYNNTKCSIFDKTKFLNITSNQIQLLEGYWRPNHMSDQTEYCYKNQEFCEGGWKVGNDLCKFGHIGALCEECDIYNIKGEGKFFKITSDQICTECSDAVFDSLLPIFFAFIWSILQIILSLRSIDNSNRLFYSLKMRQSQRLSKILFKQSQDHQSILIKMFINYIWIFSLIFTFNIQFSIFFGFVDKASNISSFMANSLECQISEINNIQLIYSRIITMFIIVLILFLIINGGFLIHTLLNFKYSNLSLYCQLC
ncbi:unnamed protein product [Paramecium sonneborni]|uniref:Transmembrane protein n=1 Tax=Paramecium sonneborni TaxID=65129 RepID=A0A8S1PZ28_9CILI|nr:unnamed protein product [Paramecium sonneborni]